jgi:hypothetical protein
MLFFQDWSWSFHTSRTGTRSLHSDTCKFSSQASGNFNPFCNLATNILSWRLRHNYALSISIITENPLPVLLTLLVDSQAWRQSICSMIINLLPTELSLQGRKVMHMKCKMGTLLIQLILSGFGTYSHSLQLLCRNRQPKYTWDRYCVPWPLQVSLVSK